VVVACTGGGVGAGVGSFNSGGGAAACGGSVSSGSGA